MNPQGIRKRTQLAFIEPMQCKPVTALPGGEEWTFGSNSTAIGFDALLVGVYENSELVFVAKVKNGFVPRIRMSLFPTLKALHGSDRYASFEADPQPSSGLISGGRLKTILEQ
jgi:ATP-dependent DNA ligase